MNALNGDAYHEIAVQLDQAERRRTPIAPLSETYAGLTQEQAYAIQSAWFALKMAEGERLFGRKIGLTSRAMQELLGVDQPDYGFLLDNMNVPSGSELARNLFLAPRLEPEISFWLSRDLRGPGVTIADVLAATRGVCASLELVDSRIVDWRIKLVDTIADNASSARVIASERIVPSNTLDLATEEVILTRDGERVGSGNGAAVLGHPAAAAAWLANKLAEYDTGLLAGQLVLPGAMCAAVPVVAGSTYTATFSHLGTVSICFV
jgi:2-keto-4-pentenoate hydratase